MLNLRIPLKIWQQMTYYTKICLPNEVTGIGTLKKLKNGDLEVERLFLPYQKISTFLCTFEDTALHSIITDLMVEGKSEEVEKLKFRWHSHGYGKCFFSGTDKKDISEWSGDWVVNLVMNADNQYLARADIFEPICIEDYPVNVLIDYPMNRRLFDICKGEIDARVSVSKKKGEKLIV